jgi:hypothetical protein
MVEKITNSYYYNDRDKEYKTEEGVWLSVGNTIS